MTDDNIRRPFPPNTSFTRPAASQAGGQGNGNGDPLAELARLIGQTDPFAEFAREPRAAAPQYAAYQAPPVAPVGVHADIDPYGAQPGSRDQQSFPPPNFAPASPPPQFLAEAGHDQADYGQGQLPPPGYGARDYYQDGAQAAPEDDIYDDVPPRRRIGIIAIAGVFLLAVLGTAGAFGYRAMFGSTGTKPPPVIKAETTPSKVVPAANSEPQPNKLIYDRVGERDSSGKLVSREERPVDLKDQQTAPSGDAQPSSGSGNPSASQIVNALTGNEPKKVRTIAIRPDQPSGGSEPLPASARTTSVPTPSVPAKPVATTRIASAPPTATADAEDAPRTPPVTRSVRRPPAPASGGNAPLSLNPDAQAAAPASARAAAPAPTRVASAPPAAAPSAGNGQYVVQISSQRSEADAQASFRSLQGKYPGQLGSRQPMIKRADLGGKGVYYRAMVGPFANAGEANQFCSGLKSAGGQCIVQKN